MKVLYLLRHAEAEINQDVLDIDRALTKLGKSEVIALSSEFKNKPETFDLILCSPSRRTRDTCQLFIEESDIKTSITLEPTLYNPSLNTVLQKIASLDAKANHVLLVSHNPIISELANFLLDPRKKQVSLGTANMAILVLDIDSWSQITKSCADISCFI